MATEKELDLLEEESIKKELKAKLTKTSFEQLLTEYRELTAKLTNIVQQLKENEQESKDCGTEVWKFKFSIDENGNEALATNSWHIATKQSRDLYKRRANLVNATSLLGRQINKIEKIILTKAKS